MRQHLALLVALLGATNALAQPHPLLAPAVAPSPAPLVAVADEGPLAPGEREFAGCRKYPATKRFRWSVRGEVGLAELVASVGEIGCQTIVVGPAVAARGGKVALEVPDLLTAGEVYHLFLSALDALGLTVEETGHTLKIIDTGRAKEASIVADNDRGPSDQFVTRIIHVEHARPADIAELLNKLRGKDGDLTIYAPTSSLIITDRAANVRRLESLTRALDTAQAGDRYYTLTTHTLQPTELVGALGKLLGASRHQPHEGDAKTMVTASHDGVSDLVPVDSAHLIVMVGNAAGFALVASLCQRLDPLEDATTNPVHVIYLSHTNADDIAKTLQSVGISSRSGTTPAPTGHSATGALPFTGEVRIGADTTSNSIVVFASGPDFKMVHDLVAQLDLPRRQVYVEAVVLDVSVDRESDLGITWHGAGTGVGGTTTVNGVTTTGSGFVAGNQSAALGSISTTSLVSAAQSGGLLAGLLGPSYSLAGASIPSFGVILQALETHKDVNVISRPHLLTMDNTKALLSVGQKIPFPTQSLGSATVSATTPAILQTYTRQDVALKMELTPHLNDSESIRLSIKGEIDDVADVQSTTQAGGPTTDNRTIETDVVVQDGETVVLGGLQKETEAETETKIPGLGDIPVLGKLFQTKSKSKIRQELLIILTPYIIRGPADLTRIYERKEMERRDFLERYSAFRDDGAFDPHVDYRRKRGLLEEINVTALAAEREARAVQEAANQIKKARAEGEIATPL